MILKLHGTKLMYHIDTLLKWKNNEMFPPIFMEFGPVSGCNHHCIHCYVKGYNQKIELMKENVYLRFMREIGEYGVKAVVLAGCGESLIHKATPKAIEIAKKSGTDVGMFTNGIHITDNNIYSLLTNLTFIRLTINGCSKESYSKIHRCDPKDWEKIIENLKNLVACKKKNNLSCTIGVYTIFLNDNMTELEKWIKKLKEIGVDYVIIKPPEVGLDKVKYVDLVKVKYYEPVLKQIALMNSPNFTIEIRWDLFKEGCVKDYKQCLGLPFMCAVDADGSVYACNWFWKKDSFKYGDLNKNTFKEIWEGERKAKIIERVSSEHFDFSECGLCRQNSINKFLWELINPPDHINFI